MLGYCSDLSLHRSCTCWYDAVSSNVQLPRWVQKAPFPSCFPPPLTPTSFLLPLPQIPLSLMGSSVRCVACLGLNTPQPLILCDDQLKVSAFTATEDSFLNVFFYHRFDLHEGQTFNKLLPDTKIHEEVFCALSESSVLPFMSTGTEHPHPKATKTAAIPKSQHPLGPERSHHQRPPQPAAKEHGLEGHFTDTSLCTF